MLVNCVHRIDGWGCIECFMIDHFTKKNNWQKLQHFFPVLTALCSTTFWCAPHVQRQTNGPKMPDSLSCSATQATRGLGCDLEGAGKGGPRAAHREGSRNNRRTSNLTVTLVAHAMLSVRDAQVDCAGQ